VAHTTHLTRMIQLGMTALTDTGVLTEPRKFWRNGPKGHLHIDSGCYKFNGLYGDNSVTLSLQEAAGKRQCVSCWEPRALDPQLARVLRAVLDAGDLLDRAQGHIEGKRSISDSGAAFNALDSARQLVNLLKEDDVDMVSQRIEELKERTSTLEERAREKLDTAKQLLPAWSAASLLRNKASGGSGAIPGVEQVDGRIYGEQVSHRSSEAFILDIFGAWCSRRRLGLDKAETEARQKASEARLSHIGQLKFPMREPLSEGDLLTQAETLWRREATLRLEERLLPAWESAYQEILAKNDPCVVGLTDVSNLKQNETRTIIDAYPHKTGRGDTLVLRVPEMLAIWVTTFETRWNVVSEYVKLDVEPELLETVAALWQPRDRDSEFNDLKAAISAATCI